MQSFKIKITTRNLLNSCVEKNVRIPFSFLNFHRQIRGLRMKDIFAEKKKKEIKNKAK